MNRALVLIALLGCSKDAEPPPKQLPVADATPKPTSIVTLAAMDVAATHPVSATALVVVKADGTTMLIPRPVSSADVELAPLASVAADSLDVLGERVLEAQRAIIAERTHGATKDACAVPFAVEGTGDAGADSGGWGFGKSGFGPGGGAPGQDTLGLGGYGTIGGNGRINAGMIGTRSTIGSCHAEIPLVIADAQLPAAKLVEVLTTLVRADLAVATDGGTRARMLPITMEYTAGTEPPGPWVVELGFTLRPDGATGSAYKGRSADPQAWTWTGELGGLADAYHQGHEALRGRKTVRLRLDGDVSSGALITAIGDLLASNVDGVSIGEPVDVVVRLGYGTGESAPRRRGGPVPTVKLGQPKLEGEYDKATLRRYLRRQRAKLIYCYEKQLLAKPGIDGAVETTFTIGADGLVNLSSASGVDPDVSSCVGQVLESIRFPTPKNGPVTVKHGFTFHPSGG